MHLITIQVINAGCYNLPNMTNTEVCVGVPGKAYVTPTVTLVVPTVAATPAPVPSDIAEGTTTYCGTYYQVAKGDYCNMVRQTPLSSFLFTLFSNPCFARDILILLGSTTLKSQVLTRT